VPGEEPIAIDLGRQRTIAEIIRDALRLYASQPVLFMLLTGIVIVPYEVIVVLLERGREDGVSVGTAFLLVLVNLALIGPCIAALQVQAVLALADGARPQLGSVLRRGFAVLPVVAAAEIIAGICIAAGLVFFIIPGVIIGIRLAVVAQAAAVEHTDWPGALRRSAQLTHRNAWRVLGLLVIDGLVNELPSEVTGSGRHLATTITGIVLAVVLQAFVTLTINILYFDLRSRQSAVPII
jgi:hypothetical protein